MKRVLSILPALGVLALGCGHDPGGPVPELSVTPSDKRASADMIPFFTAASESGETRVTVSFQDRLRVDSLPGASIQLAGGERLFAIAGGTRTELVEETYEVPGFDGPKILETRYTTSFPVADPGVITVEFDRADGTILRSTLEMPAPFAIAPPPPVDIKTGDKVSFGVTPAPGQDQFGFWSAWCDAHPTEPITDANYQGVYVAPSGSGALQFGATRYNASNDCEGRLQIKLYALGTYDPAFGALGKNPSPATRPTGYRVMTVGTHLWGL